MTFGNRPGYFLGLKLHCYIAGVFPSTAFPFTGYFMVTPVTSNNETVCCQIPWAAGQHWESYDVKRETVHSYPWNVDRCSKSSGFVDSAPAVLVQRHNASRHSKLRQTAFKWTPKSLDYTQIGTLTDPSIINLWFWEVLGQSQSWLRTMQKDLWKLYINSRIFEFATPCPKIKLLRMRKNVIVFLQATGRLWTPYCPVNPRDIMHKTQAMTTWWHVNQLWRRRCFPFCLWLSLS